MRHRSIRISLMLGLTTGFFFVELIVGYLVDSIALVADSFHMLSDVLSMIVALYTIRLAKRKLWSAQYSYGWQRAEVLGALMNAVFLMALCFTITIDAVERFFKPVEIEQPKVMLIVGCAGLGVNIIGLFLFHEHSHVGHDHSHSHEEVKTEDATKPENKKQEVIEMHASHESLAGQRKPLKQRSLNMHGVFLHILGDALGSVAVVISALVIWLATGWENRYIIDPILSLFIVAIILFSTIPLVRRASFILLQGTPHTIPMDELRESLLRVPNVSNIHDLHVWQLSDTKIVASLHVVCHPSINFMALATQIQDVFHTYGVHSATVQPEFQALLQTTSTQTPATSPRLEHQQQSQIKDRMCLLRCSSGACDVGTCCPEDVTINWNSNKQKSRPPTRTQNSTSPEPHLEAVVHE